MMIKCNEIYFDDGVRSGYVDVQDGRFAAFHEAYEGAYEDYSAYRMIPGIIDTHNHGVMGYGLFASQADEQTMETLVKGYLKGCASQGVTAVFPTADVSLFPTLAKLAKTRVEGATIAGIHSEGPYLNRVGEKGINTGYPEVNMEFVAKAVKDAAGYLRLMAIAPEIPQADEVITYLQQHNVKCAYAHSDCNYHEAMKAFDNGLTVATHTANVMSGIHHRNMGGLGACLLHDGVDCEVICDGLHVAPEMLKIMFKVKNYDRFMMISDCTPMSGAPTGRYNMGKMIVNCTDDGFCLSDTGRLMGSSKPVLYGMKVLSEKLEIPMTTICRMAAANAARVYQLNTKGVIQQGKDADFVIINENFDVIATYAEGSKVYDHSEGSVFNKASLEGFKLD